MNHKTDRGTPHQLKQICLSLNKTNEKLDKLVDLLAKMISDNIKIHNNR